MVFSLEPNVGIWYLIYVIYSIFKEIENFYIRKEMVKMCLLSNATLIYPELVFENSKKTLKIKL